MKPKIISFFNISGNINGNFSISEVAKTVGSAVKDSRILLIDLNPKANLTLGFDLNITLKDPIDSALYSEKVVIRRTKYPNINLVPAGARPSLVKGNNSIRFRNFLKKTKHSYDYIIMDIAAKPVEIAELGLRSSDYVVLPICIDLSSLAMISKMASRLKRLNSDSDHKIKIAAVIATDYNPKSIAKLKIGTEIGQLSEEIGTVILGTRAEELMIIDEFAEPVLKYTEIIKALKLRVNTP